MKPKLRQNDRIKKEIDMTKKKLNVRPPHEADFKKSFPYITPCTHQKIYTLLVRLKPSLKIVLSFCLPVPTIPCLVTKKNLPRNKTTKHTLKHTERKKMKKLSVNTKN